MKEDGGEGGARYGRQRLVRGRGGGGGDAAGMKRRSGRWW